MALTIGLPGFAIYALEKKGLVPKAAGPLLAM
jgi:hypothetical protein